MRRGDSDEDTGYPNRNPLFPAAARRFLSEGSPVRGGLTIENDHGDWEFATPDDRIRLEDRQRKRFDLVLDLRNGGGVSGADRFFICTCGNAFRSTTGRAWRSMRACKSMRAPAIMTQPGIFSSDVAKTGSTTGRQHLKCAAASSRLMRGEVYGSRLAMIVPPFL